MENLYIYIFLPFIMNNKNYITPNGHKVLRAELENLVKIERPKIVDIVSWAASNGDRSENGDYIYGKKRLREIDKRIRFLSKRLDISEIVNPLQQKDNKQIFFGATVVLDDENGEEKTYSIVGIDEANASENKISWISPLAKMLLKKFEGDSINLKTPSGFKEFDIVEVIYKEIL